MAPYELEITISSAKNLKNVNWRHGPLNPYAVVWVDPKNKYSTHVDDQGDESPIWDEKLTIPLTDPIHDSTLNIDIVHANAAEDTKPLIGSAKIKLKDVVDEVGIGELYADSLKLKRPSGRPHGKLDVQVCIREPRYGYYAPAYGVPPPPPPAVQNYAAPPGYGGNYPYAGPAYGGNYPDYGAGAGGGYGGQPSYGGYKEEEKSKYGMGTGLAVGAAAGCWVGWRLRKGLIMWKMRSPRMLPRRLRRISVTMLMMNELLFGFVSDRRCS